MCLSSVTQQARHARAQVTRETHHTRCTTSRFSQVVLRTLSPPFALREPPRLSSFLRYVVSYGTRCSVFFCDELTDVFVFFTVSVPGPLIESLVFFGECHGLVY